MPIEYFFDGTNIKFDIVILDSTGLIPQTGKAVGLTVTVYDSARNVDAATITTTEIGTTGVYELSTPYADIYRTAGDGLWRWRFSHTDTTLTFQPKEVSILINVEIGTATGIPTTTTITVSGLKDISTNHYKESYLHVISGSNSGESKKISASVDAGAGNVTLTVNEMSGALAAGDKIMVINR